MQERKGRGGTAALHEPPERGGQNWGEHWPRGLGAHSPLPLFFPPCRNAITGDHRSLGLTTRAGNRSLGIR